MKRFLLTLVLSGSIFFMQSQTIDDSLLHDAYQRTFRVHLPSGYNCNQNYPLIIALHGGFGSGPQLEIQSELSHTADSAKFIVVYPDGVERPVLHIRTWNAGDCCGWASSNNIDDVGFISKMMDKLFLDYCIDTTRVYATGMSNGAFMDYRLACEIGDRLAAIAPVSGSMTLGNTCQPNSPLPIIHFHSYQDQNIPFMGGVGSGPSQHYNPPVDSVLSAWAGHDQCSVDHDTLHNGSDYDLISWSNCSCNDSIKLYVTYDGGHSWPGGQKTATGDSVSSFINASELMWNFFKQYTIACHPSGLEKEIYENTLDLSPNPVQRSLIISLPYNADTWTVELLDINGQLWRSAYASSKQLNFDVEKLPAGLYLIRAFSESNFLTGIVVKTTY